MNRDEARELYKRDPAALWDDAHKRGEESWGGERVAFATWRAQQTAAVLELLYPHRDALTGRVLCDLGTGNGYWQSAVGDAPARRVPRNPLPRAGPVVRLRKSLI